MGQSRNVDSPTFWPSSVNVIWGCLVGRDMNRSTDHAKTTLHLNWEGNPNKIRLCISSRFSCKFLLVSCWNLQRFKCLALHMTEIRCMGFLCDSKSARLPFRPSTPYSSHHIWWTMAITSFPLICLHLPPPTQAKNFTRNIQIWQLKSTASSTVHSEPYWIPFSVMAHS